MTDITENGLDLPKQQLVDQYLGQISDITSMITEAQNAAKMQMETLSRTFSSPLMSIQMRLQKILMSLIRRYLPA